MLIIVITKIWIGVGVEPPRSSSLNFVAEPIFRAQYRSSTEIRAIRALLRVANCPKSLFAVATDAVAAAAVVSVVTAAGRHHSKPRANLARPPTRVCRSPAPSVARPSQPCNVCPRSARARGPRPSGPPKYAVLVLRLLLLLLLLFLRTARRRFGPATTAGG